MLEEKQQNPRAVAWSCLQRWAKRDVFAETLINRDTAGFAPSDRAMAQAIVYGVLRHGRWLEHMCRRLRPEGLEESVRWLVLSGLCQLFILNQAEHAAVCETVGLAPKRVRGVVNGMLRNAVRRRQELMADWETLPLGVRYSTPDWLVERWISELGKEETERMLEWNNRPAPVYARLNELNPMPIPPGWLELGKAPGWYRLPEGGLPLDALRAGHIYIADPSTRYSINMLAPQAGERILDACAAPGGKSAAILAATMGNVRLVATDSAAYRLNALRENLQRAGGTHVRVESHDWTLPCPEAYLAAFDAVLLDAPCSNSGVLQRRVDARWRLDPHEFDRLSLLQSRLLDQASAAVRPGGRLVYSTCSIDRQEDRLVIDQFLARHQEYALKDDYLALPHREQADGAYAALLVRSTCP